MNKKEEKNNAKPISYKPVSEGASTSNVDVVDTNLIQEQEWHKYDNTTEKVFYYLKQKGYLINTFTEVNSMKSYISLMGMYDEPRKTLIEKTKKCMGLSYDLGKEKDDILNNIIKSMKKDKWVIEKDNLTAAIHSLGLLWSLLPTDKSIITTFPCLLEDFEKYYLPIIKMMKLVKQQKYNGHHYYRLPLGLLYFYTINPDTSEGQNERKKQLKYIKTIHQYEIDNKLLSYYSFRE